MWQNDQQRAAVCDRLCTEAGIRERLWYVTSAEPTDAAVAVRDGRTLLSHGERLMALAAWDLWNGTGNVRIVDLVDTLDPRNLKTLAGALRAIANGPEAIDHWLLYSGRPLRLVRDAPDQ